ncbi:polysaccharide biosynthesis/export family protein [Haliea sp. E1-2-M8]|uniref:polysaccharide biosynthesis/export family protein n=1 Tax=Haliea sp. E1-2-M8 TaxID=3064706 RepID=UPI00271ADB93|nr:polysaccharide biosynthesis/export family protein [Haliea sp. E1-2-M8]MDO8862432.1 polysaccharide biosynthesis/export family protein [Haliea sp. E1-2-M8]
MLNYGIPRLLLLTLLLVASGCGGNKPQPNVVPGPAAAGQGGSLAPLRGSNVDEALWARTDQALPDSPTASAAPLNLSEFDYVLGPSDELDITVFQIPDLSGTRVVNSRGQIRMPLLGAVDVAGLSAQQVEDLLVTLYSADYLQDPQISVDVSVHASQQITLLGQVVRPGVYPLTGPTTLLQVIAMGGGPTRVANEEEVVVFRQEPSGDVYGYLINLDEIIAGIKGDPEVIGSDRIMVPESGLSSFMRGFSIGIPGFGGYRQY